MSCLIMLI